MTQDDPDGMKGAMSAETAHAVFDALVEHAEARESLRVDFVHHQTHGHLSEYRFGGVLGFGGKFWRNTGFRADGSFGETWYVNAYPEDTRDGAYMATERRAAVAVLAPILDDLRAQHETASGAPGR